MNYHEIKEQYEHLIVEDNTRLTALKKQIFTIGTIRLAIALATAMGIYWAWNDMQLAGIIFVAGLALFLILAKFHDRLFRKKQYFELKIDNTCNELKALGYDFSAFDAGNEFASATHSYANDLDLFGKRSLFQSLNRTVTLSGKKHLAQSLLDPLSEKDSIGDRQEAIDELSQDQHLIDHFRATGQMAESLNTENIAIGRLSDRPLRSTFWRITPVLYPILFVSMIVFCACEIIPSALFIIFWMAMIPISLIPTNKINQKLDSLTKKQQTIDSYTKLLQIVEDRQFKSKYLNDLQNNIREPESAYQSIKVLNKLVHNAGLSLTFLGLIFFNPVLSWNVMYAIRIENWIKKRSLSFSNWTDTIGRFDSLLSFARFKHNHPDYVFPQISTSFAYQAQAMGHPLINRNVCVRNDIDITSRPYFMVVTGANMAGKSTYLRTVGINLTLASAGSVVCAEQMNFYPFQLVTNLRTSDSLNDNESYFFAELKRLKMIIDRLESGEELFIILDEILKGTNSEDKQRGSLALMKQLVSMNGNGIIATHDLELGNLETEFPEAVRNYRFEADITDNELTFSYRMQAGVARNMNACFLMKKMGITGLD